MGIEDKESKRSLLGRLFIKSLFIFVISWTIIVMILSLFLGMPFVALLSLFLFVLVYYLHLKNRIVKIKFIKDNLISLQDGIEQVELEKGDILYVFKFIRFAFTNHFLLAIAMRDGNLLTRKRYLLFNDPQNDAVTLFKNMGINLKNVP